MGSSYIIDSIFSFCKSKLLLLSFFSLTGLFLGCQVALLRVYPEPSILELYSANASVINLFFTCFFPFLLVSFALHRNNFRLLNFFVLQRMFSFGFSTVLILNSSQGSGWFIRLITMFSQSLLLPLYFYFIIHAIQGSGHIINHLLIILIPVVLVVSLNHLVINAIMI